MKRVPYRYELICSWKSIFVPSDDEPERIVEAAFRPRTMERNTISS